MNKSIYYLAFIYLLSGLFVLSFISFIRSNVITNISISNFTIKQCETGFYGVFTSIFINRSLLYLILLYRIKLVFQDSTYEYSSTLLQILFACIISYCIISIILLFWVDPTHWNLHTNSQWNLIYCSRDDDFNPIIIAHKGFVAIMDFIFNIAFLYMFVSKLNLLRKELVKQYLADHSGKYLQKLQHVKTLSKSQRQHLHQLRMQFLKLTLYMILINFIF